MKFIKKITWDEVFESWRNREASNPGWIHCATVVKGWPDWESWRKHSAEQIHADEREWKLYEFTDPINEVTAMLVGPYSGWQSRFANKNVASFEDLLEISEQFNEFSKHQGVLSIIEGLPFDTEFIGIIRDDIDKIVCLEGHHRATAIALAKKLGKKIDFTKSTIRIALTHLPADEVRILDEVLKRGTSKNPEGLQAL